MQESLNVLKQSSIISYDEVTNLRQSILQSHPDLNEAQRAQLFAQSLHKKLDQALSTFDVSIQKNIKHHLLKQAVTKPHFSINALDILETYVQIDTHSSSNIPLLTSWVSQYKSDFFTEEIVLSLTRQLSLPSNIPTLDLPLDASPLKQPQVCSTLFSFKTATFKWFSLKSSILVSVLLVIIFSFLLGNLQLKERKQFFSKWSSLPVSLPIAFDLADASNYLQESLQYKTINEKELHNWLIKRQSVLATEPYFSAIIDTAKAYDINPLLLFAITGQEQNFVPSSHESALSIANNPFNLYGSWQQYNTSIEDAATIVSRTIIRLGKDCPPTSNQIEWINHQYAEDPNWHIGVTYFLKELEQVAGQ